MSKRGKSRFKKVTPITATLSKSNSLEFILAEEQRIGIEKQLALEKAFGSNDVPSILKAQNYINSIEKKQEIPIKSLMSDPMDVANSFGYKDKPYQLSYDMLRAMSKTHIIKAIIGTRKSQVLNYCDPQRDKYSTGFVIDKKGKWRASQKDKKLTAPEQKKAEEITEFILNCGNTSNKWHGDTFEKFMKKLLNDSLEIDQATFEVVRDRAGRPIEFFATDGATYRIADSYSDESKSEAEEINGYKPYYVQVYNGRVEQEFYPWELSFGTRNASTDIRTNGYGKAELEDMIQTITSILNSDLYNANFFKVGSDPKGIITYSGNINQNTINDFRQQWQAQVAGAVNAHKTPIINGDKINWIPTHVPNKDMEFAKYQEFLIKIGCAIYIIDPSEIGFPMDGASDGNKGLGGGNNAEKLKYSKDKGLKPLLKDIQGWLNTHIVSELDPEFELRFVGIDDEEDKVAELDSKVKQVTNYKTVNEVRAMDNLDPLDGMDIILNPVASQATMMGMQGDPNSNEAVDQMQGGGENPNPFMKSLQHDLGRLLS